MSVTAESDIASVDPWQDVVGQQDAKARLASAASAPVHAYMFLGSKGSGTFAAALGFAGLVLASALEDSDQSDRAVRLAVSSKHPDVIVVDPEGAALRVSEAEEIAQASLRTPVEGKRKVIIVSGVESIEEAAIGKLLKVVEEPPPSTVFVLLASEVPPEIVTIASRCVPIEFAPLSALELEAALVADGIDQERASIASVAAGGDLERAKLLATDDALAQRAELWLSLPDRLNGSGYMVYEMVEEIQAGISDALGPLEARQAEDLADLEARVEQLGERGSGRADLVARHKREARKLRTDELRFGLATLSRHYRDRLLALGADHAAQQPIYEVVGALQQASEGLVRNPNESLFLQNLFLRLSPGEPA